MQHSTDRVPRGAFGQTASEVTKVARLARRGHFLGHAEPHNIVLGETLMDREKIIRDGLLLSLAERYEADRSQFVTLARHTMDSSFAREVVAELRNEGHILEEMRGVIRLTPRGYQSYKSRRFSDTRGN